MTLLTHAIDAEGDGALQTGDPLTVHTTAVLLAFGADPELAGPDGDTRQARSLHRGKQRPEHGSRLIREHVARHKHKAAPDDFEDPLAARSEADRDSLPARSKKRLLVRRDR
ncbi:hypothetical protein [Streptomyces lavendulae]|uniref:hypothetical protein n=1 Tax=Streptomyces lavendulae TaxID=1914 RepID=UPI0036E428E9